MNIADLVIADMEQRKKMGIAKYGLPLQANNGRNALQDAYEEALDMAMYLRQAIEERHDAVRRQVSSELVFLCNAHHITAGHGGALTDCRHGICPAVVAEIGLR